MKVKVWTAAADDRWGTRATVHVTEKGAYEQWLEWQFSSAADDEEDRADRETARAFIEAQDYDGLLKWKSDELIGEPFDTYAVEEHEIEVSSLVAK
ncbi:MAG: hypothetical protein ABR976_16255 [Terracidiphilus sp.]